MSTAFLMSLTEEFLKRVNSADTNYGCALLRHMSPAELEEVRERVTHDCSEMTRMLWLPVIRAIRYPHLAGKPLMTVIAGGKVDAAR